MSDALFAAFKADDGGVAMRGLAAQLIHLSQLVSADGRVGAGQIKSAAVELALDLLPFVSWVSITELEPPSLQPLTTASSAEQGTWLDGLQYLAGEGPCLQALIDGEVVTSPDLKADTRWPGFAARIPQTDPQRSVRCHPLWAAGGVVASLNLYSEPPAARCDQNDRSASLVAAVISLVIGATRARQHGDRVTAALADDRRVATATGVLMGRHSWSQEAAFTALRDHLEEHGGSAGDVASHVIDTGELPG